MVDLFGPGFVEVCVEQSEIMGFKQQNAQFIA